jgi:outer membrane receptor protein involved in Fe transport
VDPLTFVDTTSASREGRVGGNPDLNVETADTLTYGVVLTPNFGFLSNLSVAVDYYDIELSDFIQQVTGQTLANRCVDLPQRNQFCDLIQRGPDGRINFFEAYLVNIAERRVRGWDISAQYLFDPQDTFNLDRDLGTFAITAAANRVQSLELREAPDAPINERVTYPEAPKWTFVGDVTWSFDRWTVNYGYTWVDEVRRQTFERMAANPDWVAPEFVYFSARSTHDISVRYSINDNFAVSAGVNNFTNQRPDLGSEDQPVSALGRYYFLGVSASF